MDAYDLILAILHNRGDANLGRNAIQSLAYLAVHAVPSVSVPPYSMQYHGPYSEGLGHTLERLVSHSFVVESGTPGNGEAYGYSLSGDGAKMAEGLSSGAEHGAVRSMMERCRDACGLRAEDLAFAAGRLYAAEGGARHADGAGSEGGARVLDGLGLDHG